ncbi:MAG: c-type cytochrome [Candidatus Aminicenantales bacterium]
MAHRKKKIFTILSFTLTFLILEGVGKPLFPVGNSSSLPLPENPLKGSKVFIHKGCINCHKIWGIGGDFGPDLTKIGQEKNFFELAGSLWSHSPKMIEVMKEKNIERPVLSPQDIEELMAYLYYQGFFDESGDYLKGETLFSSKGCLKCHSLGGEKKKRGPSLDRYGRYVSPVFIATALWNHSSTISELMLENPLNAKEMSHLLAYIKEEAINRNGETVYMEPGSPREGEAIFLKKKCTVCHKSQHINLKESDLRKSLTEIVRMMWNHSYQMWEEMKEKGLDIPVFENKEMADLMAYLYFLQYYSKKGSAKKGRKVFQEKGCISCHSQEAVKKKMGIDLAEFSQLNVFELISIMWNHLPQMEKMVTELKLEWPRFEKDELKDLIRYIQSLKK